MGVGWEALQGIEIVGENSAAIGQFDAALALTDGQRQAKHIAGKQAMERIRHMPNVKEHAVELHKHGLGSTSSFFIIGTFEFDHLRLRRFGYIHQSTGIALCACPPVPMQQVMCLNDRF